MFRLVGVPRGQVAGRRVTEPPPFSCRDPDRHVKVKQRGSVLNMLRRLDKIRFRGHKRDDFLDLAESPNASDTECGDEVPLRIPRTSPRDSEELRDPVSMLCGPPGSGNVPCSAWPRPRVRKCRPGGHPPTSGGQAERALGSPVLPGWPPLCPRLVPEQPSVPGVHTPPLIEDQTACLHHGSVQQLDFFSFLTGFLGGWPTSGAEVRQRPQPDVPDPRQLAEPRLGPHRPLWARQQGAL